VIKLQISLQNEIRAAPCTTLQWHDRSPNEGTLIGHFGHAKSVGSQTSLVNERGVGEHTHPMLVDSYRRTLDRLRSPASPFDVKATGAFLAFEEPGTLVAFLSLQWAGAPSAVAAASSPDALSSYGGVGERCLLPLPSGGADTSTLGPGADSLSERRTPHL